MLADDASFSNAAAGAFVGRDQQEIVLVAPRVKRNIGLPIRFGEKVLCRLDIPSARILQRAHSGVRSREHGAALIRWLRVAQPRLALAFTDVVTDTPLYATISQAENLGYWTLNNEPAPHLFHQFNGSYEEFFNEKSSKYKNQLRKKEKMLREQLGAAFSFKEYRSVEDVTPFLQAADSINKKTYQYKLFGEQVDNDAQSTAAYTATALKGQFRSFVLWHDDIPLCFVLGHQSADGIFEHRQTGFDPQWRDCAPGINCNILLLQSLYATHRPKILDFGSGDADYKRLFANTVLSSASPMLVPRTLRYLLPFLLYTGAAWLNAMAVVVLDRFGLKDRIKRLLRR